MEEQHTEIRRAQLTVYVVDDDPAIRDSLSLSLSLRGYHISQFANAEDFLNAFDLAWTGCVVADIRMPGSSGLQLQAELAARGSNLPVVIITGHGDVTSARAAFRAKAVDFLEKPFDDDHLIGAIETALPASVFMRPSSCSKAVSIAPIKWSSSNGFSRKSTAFARAAFRAKAVDFLEKPFDDDHLIGAIETAFEHELGRMNTLAGKAKREAMLSSLSPREREVMTYLIKGLHAKEIGEQLGISHRTVEVHKAHIMEKMGVRSVIDIVRLGERVAD